MDYIRSHAEMCIRDRIGFDLQDGDEDYSGEYGLMSGDRIDRDLIDMIPHYKESPLVQNCLLYTSVEDETLSELAESIKEFGIVTPIITRTKEDGNGYEVIAGQRRVRASELAGINTVPCLLYTSRCV